MYVDCVSIFHFSKEMLFQMYGVIFVIDASSINNICQSYKIFKNLMAHDFLIGKPFLIIANKQDLPGSVDCIDICEYLDVEFLANKFRNPCMLEACGNWEDESDEYDGLMLGVNWLVKTIISNKQFLTNRINFHRVMLEQSSKLFQSHRPCTGIRRKVSFRCQLESNTRINIKISIAINNPSKNQHT